MEGMLEYTYLWNLIGFPCGAFPVTRVQKQEEFFKDHYQDRWTAALNVTCQKSEFMPIALQIIGYAHEDEQILGIMRKMEKKLNYGLESPVIQKSLISQKLRIESIPTGKLPYDIEEPKASQGQELETN